MGVKLGEHRSRPTAVTSGREQRIALVLAALAIHTTTNGSRSTLMCTCLCVSGPRLANRLKMFLSDIWSRTATGGIRAMVAGRRLTSAFMSLRSSSNCFNTKERQQEACQCFSPVCVFRPSDVWRRPHSSIPPNLCAGRRWPVCSRTWILCWGAGGTQPDTPPHWSVCWGPLKGGRGPRSCWGKQRGAVAPQSPGPAPTAGWRK